MAAKAVETWQKVLAADQTCADAYWRIARAHYWLGSQAKDEAKKRQFFKDGIEYAKLGVSADRESTACHFWLGVMYGSYGQAVGASQSLHMVDPIKHEMQWILAKDEGFDEGGAHRVLGRLYYKLPGLMGGDNHKAKEHLRRAIELGGKTRSTSSILPRCTSTMARRTRHAPCSPGSSRFPTTPTTCPRAGTTRRGRRSSSGCSERSDVT